GVDWPLTVDRVAERVHHPANQPFADWHREQLAGRADFHPLGDLQVVAENDDCDGVLFEVERQTFNAGLREVHKFPGHHFGKAVAACDAVADLKHLPDGTFFDLAVKVANLFGEDADDFASGWIRRHFGSPLSSKQECTKRLEPGANGRVEYRVARLD